jgi:hypothetical protein
MQNTARINSEHPLRKLFRKALDFGFESSRIEQTSVLYYLEEQILCEFIRTDSLYKIRDTAGRRLEDIADMLLQGDVRLNAQSFDREYLVHKHIGDYTLFMLGIFPEALNRRKGKEFILGRLIIPVAGMSEHYELQGRRSYQIASRFTHKELFLELSSHYLLYRNVLTLTRAYLESVRNREFLKAKGIVSGTE